MQEKKNTLAALSAAALVLNTLAGSSAANPPDQKTTIDYRYSNYGEGDIDASKLASGSESRYTIDVHQIKLKVPVASDTELTLSGTQEVMSGASPWYVLPNTEGKAVQVMSGATIDETRNEIGLDFRGYHEKSESTLSLSHSTENDYTSFAFGYSGQRRLNENLSTLNYGISASKDYIDATDADIYVGRPEDESKTRVGGFFGFSQVMTKDRLFGMTLSASTLNGYLSDTYKAAWVIDQAVQDSRPDKQSRASLSMQLREFFPKANGAFHFDLRFYQNDWEMTSETVDIAWYQNLGNNWQLIPSLRYYSQSEAAFYKLFYTTSRRDGYYSSDYRLSEFSAFSGRIKLGKSWEKFSVNLLYENYSSSGDHPGLVSFDLISMGLGANF